MKTKWWVGLLAAVIAAGCVPSLHPWFSDKDVVFEEKLLGVWEQEDEDNLWIFERGDGESKGYQLTITSKEKDPALLQAHLFKINGKFYLDMYPAEDSLESSNDFFKIHLAGMHQLLRIDAIQPTVQFRMLNPETIGKMLKEKPDLIDHESPEDDEGILLTAATEKLQKFLAENSDAEKFYSEANTLTRRNPLFTEKDFGFEPKLAGQWIDDDDTICICEAVNKESYRVTAIRSKEKGTEVSRYGCAIVTIHQRRFVAVYEGREVDINGGSDADRTPDLLLWIEQVEPTPVYRVIDYSDAAEIVKMNDEPFKQAMDKLPKLRWTPLVPAEKK